MADRHDTELSDTAADRADLRELAAVFLKLGATAFGGPAVHIAMLEQEVVHRRKWMTHEEFLDLLGAANLIPGPNSTELAIHIGLRRGGWRGLIVAGACFIVPAFFIVMACAWFYVRYARMPALQGILYGVKPVVIAVVLQALWRLGKSAIKTRLAALIAATAMAASLVGIHELAILAVAGIAPAMVRGIAIQMRSTRKTLQSVSPGALAVAIFGTTSATATPTAGLGSLFLFFVKVGSVLYGSGYVLLAFLRADLVERWGWLTDAQLLDAVAVGQVTPGPLFTTATFIGYILDGPAGAALATLGIFLPAFCFVAISAPIVPMLRRSTTASAFLDGVNAASLALMATVTARLIDGAFVDALTIGLGMVSAVTLLLFRVNPIWLILAAAVIGMAAHHA